MSSNNDAKEGKKDDTDSPINNKHKLKVGDEFLNILGNNAFNGTDGGDVINHINKILEITEWIKIPVVDKNELRLHVLLKSLSGDAKICKVPDDLDNGTDYLEFLYWLALKFNNYWETDKNTQKGLWEFYVKEQTKGTIGDLDDEPREENCKKTCSDSFYKPYLDAQDGKDIYEIINREYSPIPVPARRDISNPNELCKTEEFTVIRYLMGLDKEFVAVGPSKISTVERTPGAYEAKRLNSEAKTKTFEENLYLLPYAISSKEDTAYQLQLITRIRVRSIPNPTYHSSPIRRIQLVVSKRFAVNAIDGN
ncbi:hypothetical protein Tco_0241230 [Tanacetum coccineum]